MEKMLQYFIGLKKEDVPLDVENMCQGYVPHVEVETKEEYDEIIKRLMRFLHQGSFHPLDFTEVLLPACR